MRIIVDTNIVFSALLNTDGIIGDLIFNSGRLFDFYSCSYMRFEISKHWEKIKNISALNDDLLREAQFRLFTRIKFIDEEIIPPKIWSASEKIVHDIDIDDLDFIALAKYLRGFVWTGDKVLYKGLKRKKYERVFTTAELVAIRDKRI